MGEMLRQIHATWAWVVIVGNALAGIWALAAHWVPVLRTRALWWFTGLMQCTIVVQVVLGVTMVAGAGFGLQKFHAFYGFIALITVGLIYSYRDSLRPKIYLLYGFGGLFLMGLGIRAMLVNRGG